MTSSLSRRRRLGGALLGALVYVGLLVAWQMAASTTLPEKPFLPDFRGARWIWMQPGAGPYFCAEDLDRAELLLLGDSRLNHGVDRAMLDDAGLGPVAVLWAGAAQLRHLLPAARRYPARRILVGLSPTAIWAPAHPLATELMRKPPPSMEGPNPRRAFQEWSSTERAHLIERGFGRREVDTFLDGMVAIVRPELPHARATPSWIDAWLARWFLGLRDERLYLLSSETWRKSWFPPIDDQRTEPIDLLLRPVTRERRAAALPRIQALLAGLVSDGWKVTCVRVPVGADMLPVEDEAFEPRAFVELCSAADVPFLDFTDLKLPTRDGSHLTRRGARAFTRVLVEALR